MRDITKKQLAAIVCAMIMIGIFGVCLATMVIPLLDVGMMDAMAMGIILLYVAIILAVMVGVAAALYQRLREIKGGEEEDAKQY